MNSSITTLTENNSSIHNSLDDFTTATSQMDRDLEIAHALRTVSKSIMLKKRLRHKTIIIYIPLGLEGEVRGHLHLQPFEKIFEVVFCFLSWEGKGTLNIISEDQSHAGYSNHWSRLNVFLYAQLCPLLYWSVYYLHFSHARFNQI